MAIKTTVNVYNVNEFCEQLLSLPEKFRKKIIFYALRKAAGIMRKAVIEVLVSYGLVDTGNLRRSITIATGRVRDRKLHACLLVGIKRINSTKKIFRSALLKTSMGKTDAIRQLKKIGAYSAFYAAALERGYVIKHKNGKITFVPGWHFFARAVIKVDDACRRAMADAVREKMPIVIEEWRRKMSGTKRKAA